MKKILLSLLSIGAVAIVAVAATGAFFSDTETSTGNQFVAGDLNLTIDNTSYLNGLLNQDATWGLTDLTNQLFFNFSDLKPGDEGEDTISFHVTNDSWACMDITVTENDDETCATNETPDDTACAGEPDGDLFDGELGAQLNFVFWTDDADNVLETDEIVIASGSATTVLNSTYALADSDENNVGDSAGDPLVFSTTYYIGKAWCFGALTEDPVTAGQGQDPTVDPGVDCDGASVNNAAQTDKLMADLVFRAEQHRNNPDFQCSD